MTTRPIVHGSGLPKEQLDLIEQFESDYNSVDIFLRKELHKDKQQSFTALVSEYLQEHRGWRDYDLLRKIADVRNAIVHSKTEPYKYLAIPTPAIVQDLRLCLERLTKPECVIPRFQRKVSMVSSNDSLAQVLKLVTELEYSQFPVYDSTRFCGLLTENGITRWLARHVAKTFSLVELDEIRVWQALQDEESQANWKFVTRGVRVDDVFVMFAEKPLLEAVLITASGKVSEALLGIVTRWDILGGK